MAEEVRIFVRTGLYTAVIAAIYWFVSYELAGTVLLVSLLGGAVLFAASARKLGRKGEAPLAIEEEPVVTSSPWPFGAALAALLIALGLLYGPWLWMPGAGLALSVAYGWVTQTDP